MRAFVFTDRSLARNAGQFVWLSVDIDNPANSAFLVKFPVRGTPTFMVIDPKNETLALRYLGSATVSQLQMLLRDGAGIVSGRRLAAADEAIARADRLLTAKKPADAAKTYEEAIAVAPKRWSRFGRAAENLIDSLRYSRDYERCASRALELYPRVTGTASGTSIALRGLQCALRLADMQKPRADLIEPLTKATRAEAQNADLIDGDRAELYLILIGERRRAHDEAAMRTMREDLAAFLEKRAAAAQTPEQRASYDFYRVRVYNDLGQPEKSIPMLEQSERDLPDDYLPPLRLAGALQRTGKLEEAIAASDRALARVRGADKAMVLFRRAEILEAKGDKPAAQQTLREAIAFSESLPPGLRDEQTIEMMKKKLEKM